VVYTTVNTPQSIHTVCHTEYGLNY